MEDNPDLQTFLASRLSPAYRVRVAANGREGLALIDELMPDLVISDVMMPEMDGFEMCAALKTRLPISHIPVILLTARATSEDRLKGIGLGADDYLTKPFNHKELLARARNLIESRKLLRERFAAAIVLKPEEVTTTPVDQEFLQVAMKAVEGNMDREDFKVGALANELRMSRSTLNRKFRALLDQSTNQFIQNVRLERAADLLLKRNLTASEVAVETGFGSLSYFIRRFREKIGSTPGDFRKAVAEE
ncbi:MAG: DNA-binding response OmpR family regulator [Neolewinella sp.]